MAIGAWCEEGDLRGGCTTLDPAPSDEDVAAAIAWASEYLYEVTGRRWPGVQRLKVRPMTPVSSGCSSSRRHLSCPGVVAQELAGTPLVSIVEVKIDGQVIDPDRYRIDDARYLVATRGPDGVRLRWPACQVMDLPDTEMGTWSVDHEFGAGPPAAGVAMAGRLACELLVSWSGGDEDCQLEAGWTSITRAGVTRSQPSVAELVAAGATGVREVDLWVAGLREGQARRGAAVIVPGRVPTTRRTR